MCSITSPKAELWALAAHVHKTTYGPQVNTALYVMLLMRANPFRRQVGGGWALEIETFLGPVKWYQFVRQVPFGAQKSQDFHHPSHLPK
jgi:hypothetical protein